MDTMGHVELFSSEVLEYFGKTREELRNWQLSDAVHPDDLPRVIAAFTESVTTGKPYSIEHRCRRVDGVYRWFQVRALPVRDEAGEITGWYVVLTDIDDLKRAENALRVSERNLTLTINTIPALAWSSSADGNPEFLNKHFLDFIGLTEDQVPDWDWAAAVHPDDLNDLAETWQRILGSGKPGETEARLRRNDGEYRWFLFRANPLCDESGKIVRWYGVNTDIEDRKRAEMEVRQAHGRLAEAQRLSKTGSFVTDLQADRNWSDETYRIFEIDPTTTVTVQRVRELVHPEDRPLFDAAIEHVTAGENVDYVFRIVTHRGAVKHVRTTAHIVEEIPGRPLFVGAVQDVTESKLSEEALNRARAELTRVSRVTTLSTLTASMAHEINQPLSGIITNASTCLRMLDVDPPNVDGARETARRTIRDGNRASDVITRLRALFSNKDFTLEPLDLSETTREVIALSLSELQRNRVVVQSELAEDLPIVEGDRVQLQQVILNLLRNASDAMSGVDDRPRQLMVRTERDNSDGVRVTVRDAGVGVEPENTQKLFDAFYTTKHDGMGIGLSVSRSIIERHHGRLWAEPNDGPGTTFSFAIPGG
jgi:PAS domain S-box-containing protein